MNIRVFLTYFQDALGYDLEILNENATIQDYLDALNLFQEKHVAECKGCDGCCWERIPLTSLDIMNYIRDPQIMSCLSSDPGLVSPFIHTYCHVWGQGPVMDITLKRFKNEACIFLDSEQKICRYHFVRSFVCQTFICLPHSERAGQLRDTLLNIGEDDLVHRYLQEADKKGEAPVIDVNNQAAPQLSDYPGTPFTGKNFYHEIKIKEVIPKELWKKLSVHPGL